MKLLIVVAALIAYCKAIPNIPVSFTTDFAIAVMNGSTVIFRSQYGFLGEDNSQKRLISCVGVSGGVTYCSLLAGTSTSTAIYNYTIVNGTAQNCNVTTNNQQGWQNIWGWLPFATKVDERYPYKKCNNLVNYWKFNNEEIFLTLGVDYLDENIPVSLNETLVDPTTHQVIGYQFCFSKFRDGPPPSATIAIPTACRKKQPMNKQISSNGRQMLLDSNFPQPLAIHNLAMATLSQFNAY